MQNGLLLGRGGGDFEKIGHESEVIRPITFFLLQSGIILVKILTVTVYEAVLIGSWHWIIMLLAGFLSMLSNPTTIGNKLHIELKPNEFSLYTCTAGIFSVAMSLLGARIWPLYTIDGPGILFVEAFGYIIGLAPIFLWLRFVLIVLPLAILRPTNVLEWVALIESIMPRFRSTNFNPIDPQCVETPIGKMKSRDVPIPTVPTYPEPGSDAREVIEEINYNITDRLQDQLEIDV